MPINIVNLKKWPKHPFSVLKTYLLCPSSNSIDLVGHERKKIKFISEIIIIANHVMVMG